MIIFSLSLVRVRDVVADDTNTFEIHRIEHLKDTTNIMKNDDKSGKMLRLECDSEEEKDEWVKAINRQVKLLRLASNQKQPQFWIN